MSYVKKKVSGYIYTRLFVVIIVEAWDCQRFLFARPFISIMFDYLWLGISFVIKKIIIDFFIVS